MKITLIFVLFFSVNIAFSQKNSIKVTFKNVQKNKGKVKAGLYNEKDEQLKGLVQIADNHQVMIVFDNLSEGKYVVKAYQDLNGNEKMDFNFLGIPAEPYGLSNNIRPKFSKPKVADMIFDVKGEKNIEITLNSFSH